MSTKELANVFVDIDRFRRNDERVKFDGINKLCNVEDVSTGEILAVKIVNSEELVKSGYNQTKLLREVMILKSLKHPCIIDFKGFNFYNTDLLYNEDEADDAVETSCPTLYTEYLPNGTLEELTIKLRRGRPPSQWNNTKKQIAMTGIAAATRFFHKKNIIHRNISQNNICFDENYYPKLSDFGLSRVFDPDMQMTMTLNLGNNSVYKCPELIMQSSERYGMEVDSYSLGMVFYQILCGKVPFDGLPNFKGFQLLKQVSENGQRPKFDGSDVPKKLQNLCQACWDPIPNNRISADEIFYNLKGMGGFLLPDVDEQEVLEYIDMIEKYEASLEIDVLQISSLVSFEVPFDDEEGIDDELSRTDIACPSLPATIREQKFMFRRIIERGFSCYDEDIELALFSSLYRFGALTNENLIQISEFVNSCNQSRNTNAEEFLKLVYGEYVVPYGTTEIPDKMFIHSSKETANIPPTVTSIGKNAFYACKYLKKVNMPNSVVKVGDTAFNDCPILEIINISNSLKVIEQSFYNLPKLEYVEIPSSVTEIKAEAFAYSNNLKSVIIKNGLKKIGEMAFYYAEHLTNVEIPESVTHIGTKAFAHCSALKRVSMKAKNAKISRKAFQWKVKLL